MDDALIFAAIFMVVLTAICGSVFLVMFNRTGTAWNARSRKRKTAYRAAAAHRAFKDVM